MGTLILVISIAILVIGSIVDMKKKLTAQTYSEENEGEESCEECMKESTEEQSEVESEDYYYMMNDEKPEKSEQPKKSKRVKEASSIAPIMAMEEESNISLDFDLRQAVINQAILQNDYVENLK